MRRRIDLSKRIIKSIEVIKQVVSDDVLSQALYIVNKEAKINKDQKVIGYSTGNFDQMATHRAIERQLYELKDGALKRLLTSGKTQIIGVDLLVLPHKTMQLLIFTFNGSTFHMPVENLGKKINIDSLPSVGNYDRRAWSHRPQLCSISKHEAVVILSNYVQFEGVCA